MAEQDDVASKVLRRAQVSKVGRPMSSAPRLRVLTLCAADDPDAAEPPRAGQRQDQERLGEPESGRH